MNRYLLPFFYMLIWLMAGCRALTISPELPVTTLTTTSQVAAFVESSATPTRRPIVKGASTGVTGIPSATPDIAGTIVATIQPTTFSSDLSPDGKWRMEVIIYSCARIIADAEYAYEQLELIQVSTGAKKIITSQLQNCGGLGAKGLAGLFWSPNSRYFYYTDARDGFPDGCGYWDRPIHRLNADTLDLEYLGGGPRSPDGTMLATWQDREIVVWDINGSKITRAPAAIKTAEIGPIAWSPDGKALVYAQIASYCPFSGKSYLILLDLIEFRPTLLIESNTPSFGRPVWETLDQIHLSDENGKEWSYSFATKGLTPMP